MLLMMLLAALGMAGHEAPRQAPGAAAHPAHPSALRAPHILLAQAAPSQPDDRRKRLADIVVEALGLRGTPPTLERVRALAAEGESLSAQLVPEDPTDLYGRRWEQLTMDVMKEHYPELVPQLQRILMKGLILRTQAALKNIQTQLMVYELDTGRLPTTEEGIQVLYRTTPDGRGPYLAESHPSIDPWGHPFVYRSPSTSGQGEFDLFSLGPDGQEGTADDIRIP